MGTKVSISGSTLLSAERDGLVRRTNELAHRLNIRRLEDISLCDDDYLPVKLVLVGRAMIVTIEGMRFFFHSLHRCSMERIEV